MKKLTLKIAFVAAFAAIAGYVSYNSQKEEMNLSELALDNVEALATPRESYIGGGVCHGTGAGFTNVYCYGGYTICCWAHMDVYGKN
ncbi:MAG: NVEALA domain-containing protein [Phocaeicola sp.]